ncbi:MAG: hypothetical protein R3B72_06705 [Polyangiaceae bacterium]
MSQAYRLRVSQTVERVVVVDDAASCELELLPLLSRERMAALLNEELVRRGFEVEDGVARRDDGDGIVVEVAEGRVTVRAESETLVTQRARRHSSDDSDAMRERLEAAATREAEALANNAEARIRRQAAHALEAALRNVQSELDRVVHRVTANALEEKARALGEITELSEDPETGELTIRVKL